MSRPAFMEMARFQECSSLLFAPASASELLLQTKEFYTDCQPAGDPSSAHGPPHFSQVLLRPSTRRTHRDALRGGLHTILALSLQSPDMIINSEPSRARWLSSMRSAAHNLPGPSASPPPRTLRGQMHTVEQPKPVGVCSVCVGAPLKTWNEERSLWSLNSLPTARVEIRMNGV